MTPAQPTPAQCVYQILTFQKPAYLPNVEAGAMSAAVEAAWHAEGLPEGVSIGEYFGFVDPIHWYGWEARAKFDPYPGVPDQGILEQKGPNHIVARDCWGRVIEWWTDETLSTGAHRDLRPGVTSRADWARIKDMFRADHPWRWPGSYDPTQPPVYLPAIIRPPLPYQGEPMTAERLREMAASGEKILQFRGPSMFGDLKEEMGYEGLVFALSDDPELVKEILWARTNLALEVLDRMMNEAPFKILHFWEDAAYNAGPLVSPKQFEQIMAPCYRELVNLFRSKGGEVVSVDSDGDITRLMPGWVGAGFNHFWPMEVKAGMDVTALRRKWGAPVTFRGGIDKHVLFQGKDAIRRELERVAPVVEEGGYLPHIDHSIPTGVRFEDYCFYMEEKKRLFGIPD